VGTDDVDRRCCGGRDREVVFATVDVVWLIGRFVVDEWTTIVDDGTTNGRAFGVISSVSFSKAAAISMGICELY
jgi:hypothetical protein